MRKNESLNENLYCGTSGVTFRRTAFVRKWPVGEYLGEHIWPLSEWSDTEIDEAIDNILYKAGGPLDIPTSQYARRCAVSAYLAYEQISPVSAGIAPPNPFRPSQPR